MTLYKLKAAPIVLIEDDENKNVLPLIRELARYEKGIVNIICYEQPISSWKKVLKNESNIFFYDEFNPCHMGYYTKCNNIIIIDSVNQMALSLGWNQCLWCINKLHKNDNTAQIILVLHKDCITHSSKIQTHINYMSSAIVSYDSNNSSKIKVQLKKGGKLICTEEELSYDSTTLSLKSKIIVKENKKEDEPEKPMPSNLSTFKIETEQSEKMERYNLKLPYMSKINEGQSKVYYEPDAVDDWDEEDPDEDLDI